MNRLSPHLGLVIGAVLLAACSVSPSLRTLEGIPMSVARLPRWEDNPCGMMSVKHPLLNVTGTVRWNMPMNTTIHLLIAPNTTFETARWAVPHCAPLMRIRAGPSGTFRLPHLPVGRYFAVFYPSQVPQRAPRVKVDSVRTNGSSAHMLWAESRGGFTVAAFTVGGTPKPKSLS